MFEGIIEGSKHELHSTKGIGMDFANLKFTGGKIVDTIRNVRTNEVKVIEHGHNIVVDSVLPLIMGMLRGDLQGIQYWAIGSGSPSWDSTPINPLASETTLTHEIGRKVIPKSSIIFVDPVTFEESSTPTNCLLVSCTFYEYDCNGTWREFGIFGGNATDEMNSGYMIDKKHHPVITKTEELQIDRKIYLSIAFR